VRVVRGPGPRGVAAEDGAGLVEAFDEVVFACSAEAVLRILHQPTWCGRFRVLG
jgi:predicted NAD/FAD-binding protein